MKLFTGTSVTCLTVLAVAHACALTSFADVAAAQVTSKKVVIIEHKREVAETITNKPEALDTVIKQCQYLGTPPKTGPNALITKYCSLLAKCLERMMTGAEAPVKTTGNSFTPAYKRDYGNDFHPLEIKQSMDAVEMACLSRFLR